MTFREHLVPRPEAIHSEAALPAKVQARRGALPKVEAEPSGVELEDEEKVVCRPEETPALSEEAGA
jgi:hypothetical protein